MNSSSTAGCRRSKMGYSWLAKRLCAMRAKPLPAARVSPARLGGLPTAGRRPLAGFLRLSVALSWLASGGLATANEFWQGLQVDGLEAKLIPLDRLADGDQPEWRLTVGGGYLWFEGDADLTDAAAIEIRLGRRFETRRPVDVELFVTHVDTRTARPWSAVRVTEIEVPDPDPEPEFPGTAPVVIEKRQRLAGRQRVDGQLWHLGISASPVLLATPIGQARFELLARAGVFAAIADFDHDRGVGAGAQVGLVARTQLSRRLALEAGLAILYADYAVDGLGGTLAGSLMVGGSWLF